MNIGKFGRPSRWGQWGQTGQAAKPVVLGLVCGLKQFTRRWQRAKRRGRSTQFLGQSVLPRCVCGFPFATDQAGVNTGRKVQRLSSVFTAEPTLA
jgi:hypothetical protein